MLESHRLALINSKIAELLANPGMDVVYSPFAWPELTAGLEPALASGTPTIVSLRGVDALREPEIEYGRTLDPHACRRLSWTCRHASHVIGVSRALQRRAVDLGASPERTSVILKGTDLEKFSPGSVAQARQIVGIPDRPTVLYVGGFVPSKRIHFLLKAMQLVWEEIPKAQLILVGDGPDRDAVRSYAATVADSRIIAPGRVSRDRIHLFFQAADVFVLPSIGEGSGNVLVEGAACGIPTIGTSAAGIPDYIDHGHTGFLFERDNVDELAAYIVMLLENESLRVRMGRAGRARAEKLHPYEKMINDLVALFTRTVENAKMSGTGAESIGAR